jgi:flagellar export protein FliJ
MRSLDTLVRLHRFRVDEIRRDLAALGKLIDDLAAKDAAIVDQVAHERRVSAGDPELARSYGAFAAHALERRRRLAVSRAEIEARVAERREQLRDAFAELKRHEKLREQRAAREAAERERKAAQLLDEIALDMHRRKAG